MFSSTFRSLLCFSHRDKKKISMKRFKELCRVEALCTHFNEMYLIMNLITATWHSHNSLILLYIWNNLSGIEIKKRFIITLLWRSASQTSSTICMEIVCFLQSCMRHVTKPIWQNLISLKAILLFMIMVKTRKNSLENFSSYS